MTKTNKLGRALRQAQQRQQIATRLGLGMRRAVRMASDLGEGKWITIGGEKGGDGKKVGGGPVFIGKDGTMKTGKFAGATLEEAFKKGGKADQEEKKGDKVPGAGQPQPVEWRETTLQEMSKKQLMNVFASQGRQSYVDNTVPKTKQELIRKILDFQEKQKPENKVKARESSWSFRDRNIASQNRQIDQRNEELKQREIKLNGVDFPAQFAPWHKDVARRFSNAIARTDSSSPQLAAMEAINFASPGYVEHELKQPISFVSQRIARVAANAIDPDQKTAIETLNKWADLHDALPLSDMSRSPSSDTFKQIDEMRPLVDQILRMNGFIAEPTAAEEEDWQAQQKPKAMSLARGLRRAMRALGA